MFFHCLETILSGPLSQSPSIVIITDSLSSVHAIADPYSTHPVVTRIFTLLSTFQASSYKVTQLWVPSDKGIQGHKYRRKIGFKETTHPSPSFRPRIRHNLFCPSPH